MNEEIEKNNKKVLEVIDLLNSSKIDAHTFNELFVSVKNNLYSTDHKCEECDDCDGMIDESDIVDHMRVDDVIEFLNYSSTWEKNKIEECLGKNDYEEMFEEIGKVKGLVDLEVKTLDDVMRLEILLKVYSQTNTLSELEELLGSNITNKIYM